MKFPFDFNVTLIFRLIFPGVVLALAFLPLFAYALKSEHISVSLAALIPCEAVVLGWLVVLLDQPIYMLYEGRRYWPNFLRTRLIDRQTMTLARDREKSANFRKAGHNQRMKEV